MTNLRYGPAYQQFLDNRYNFYKTKSELRTKNNKFGLSLSLNQGGQIWRIFAQCVIVNFGHFTYENYKNSPHFRASYV
jgi:hypothetical protein